MNTGRERVFCRGNKKKMQTVQYTAGNVTGVNYTTNSGQVVGKKNKNY